MIAAVARMIVPESGLEYGVGRNVPIDRMWNEEDARQFPTANGNLLPDEMLAWSYGGVWAVSRGTLRQSAP